MLFEYTIRGYLGEKASNIASQAFSETDKKDWYRKVIRQLILKISEIETSTKHKQDLMRSCESALDELSKKKFDSDRFALYLLRVICSLIGYSGIRPYNIATLAYFQIPNQHYTEVIMEGGDVMQDYYDKKDVVTVQQEVIQDLKDKGYSDFKISLMLNMSEYRVKKLRAKI